MKTSKTIAGFDRVKRLTLGFTSMAHTKKLFCEVISPMAESPVEFENSGKKSKPMVCKIIDLETGEESLLICNAVLVKVFQSFGDKLVNKCFEVSQAPKIEGKSYRALDIFEIQKNNIAK